MMTNDRLPMDITGHRVVKQNIKLVRLFETSGILSQWLLQQIVAYLSVQH